MTSTVADILVERLIQWGVDTIFSLPGDGINGIYEALRIQQDKIKLILVRHEESAALAACGYAKFTRRLGVCLATSGPGGIHLLNGLYDAKCDGGIVGIDSAALCPCTGFQKTDDISGANGASYHEPGIVIDLVNGIQGCFRFVHHLRDALRSFIEQTRKFHRGSFRRVHNALFQQFELLGDIQSRLHDIFYVLIDSSCSLIHLASSFSE